MGPRGGRGRRGRGRGKADDERKKKAAAEVEEVDLISSSDEEEEPKKAEPKNKGGEKGSVSRVRGKRGGQEQPPKEEEEETGSPDRRGRTVRGKRRPPARLDPSPPVSLSLSKAGMKSAKGEVKEKATPRPSAAARGSCNEEEEEKALAIEFNLKPVQIVVSLADEEAMRAWQKKKEQKESRATDEPLDVDVEVEEVVGARRGVKRKATTKPSRGMAVSRGERPKRKRRGEDVESVAASASPVRSSRARGRPPRSVGDRKQRSRVIEPEMENLVSSDSEDETDSVIDSGQQKVLVEVCADNLGSVLNAVEGGADRIELCSGNTEGGLTPSIGLLQAAKRHVEIPVFVMIRPRAGDFFYDNDEIKVMMDDLKILKAKGADGFVFGILKDDGTVDVDKCQKLLKAAGPIPCTFHRAFDMIPEDQRISQADALIGLGFKRILTSGHQKTAEEGIPQLRDLVRHVNGNIVIVAGAGVKPENAEKIVKETGVKEVHGTFKERVESKMQARNREVSMGNLQDDSYHYQSSVEILKQTVLNLQDAVEVNQKNDGALLKEDAQTDQTPAACCARSTFNPDASPNHDERGPYSNSSGGSTLPLDSKNQTVSNANDHGFDSAEETKCDSEKDFNDFEGLTNNDDERSLSEGESFPLGAERSVGESNLELGSTPAADGEEEQVDGNLSSQTESSWKSAVDLHTTISEATSVSHAEESYFNMTEPGTSSEFAGEVGAVENELDELVDIPPAEFHSATASSEPVEQDHDQFSQLSADERIIMDTISLMEEEHNGVEDARHPRGAPMDDTVPEFFNERCNTPSEPSAVEPDASGGRLEL